MANKKDGNSITASSNCTKLYGELVSQITEINKHYPLINDPDSLRQELDRLFYNAVCNSACDALEPYERGHMFILIREICDFIDDFIELRSFAIGTFKTKFQQFIISNNKTNSKLN